MLISAIHQHESATGIRMPPPSWTSFPPPSPSHPSRLSQSAEFELPCHIANSHLLSILRMVMYILPCYSLNTEESTSHSIDVTSHCVCWPSSPSWGVLLGFLFPRCQGTFPSFSILFSLEGSHFSHWELEELDVMSHLLEGEVSTALIIWNSSALEKFLFSSIYSLVYFFRTV